jgi:hypothetical protein
VNPYDNPIFLTQKRLVHRGGVLAAILIAALIGLSLLSGLIAYLAEPQNFAFRSPQEAGKLFYAWTIGVEILVLVIGGFSRISNVLANERKAGLWDSNRLSPLQPWQLVTGYWFGSPLREFYMAVVLAGIGLVIVLLGRLSPMLWLGTQILIFSTALFFGLLAVLAGLVAQRPQNASVFLLLFFFLQLPSFAMPKFLLTNFLLPVFGVASLFLDAGVAGNSDFIGNWNGLPEIFGLPIYPILLSLFLQSSISVFLWRAVTRKTANPFQAPLLRWEAVVVFAILIVAQHGLMWGLWKGQFPTPASGSKRFFEADSLLSIVQCGTMLLGLVVLAFNSPQPEHVRVEALRLGFNSLGAIFPRSAVSLALALTGVAAAALFTQCAFSFADSWEIYAVAVGNLLDFFLIFVFLLEYCRLRFGRRALGFVALWLFVLCVLPFILAGVFTTTALGRLSLLSPGVLALARPDGDELNYLLGMVAAHFGIVIICFLAWQREWKRLLAKTSSAATVQ